MSRLPLVLLACTGCAQVLAQLQTSQSNNAVDSDGVHHVVMDGRTERVGPYWGPECERIDAPHRTAYRDSEAEPTMGKQPNLAHNPEDQVLRLVCVESIMSVENEPERNTYVIQHFRFDELYFDNFTAALMLVQCYEADDCLGQSAVKPHREYHNPYVEKEMAAQAAEGPRIYQLYQTGMMRWYADHIDVAAVQQRIAKLPLPPQAQQVFMSLLDRAKTGIVQMTDRLAPDAKRLFVDLPAAIYVQRQKARSKHDKLIAELGQVIDQMKAERAAGGVSDGTVDRLDKLRIAYTAACGHAPSCTRDAIFTEVTTQLFWAHVARGDAPAARAESKLLEHVDDTAAQEIAEKQGKAIEEARGRLERVARAREQGVDADAAQSTANGRVLDFGDGRYVYRWRDDFKIYWESLIPDGHDLAAFEGKVAALDRKGNQVTLRFADIVSSWSEATNCYETGRVESIDSDGHLHYREECAGSTTKTERHKVDPVTVVASELGGIGPGDEVFGFAHGDRTAGRVWFVKRGQRVVRVRDVPQ